MSHLSRPELRLRNFLVRCKEMAANIKNVDFCHFKAYVKFAEKLFFDFYVEYGKVVDKSVVMAYERDVQFLLQLMKIGEVNELDKQKLITQGLLDRDDFPSKTIKRTVPLEDKRVTLKELKVLSVENHARKLRSQLLNVKRDDEYCENEGFDRMLEDELQDKIIQQLSKLSKNLKENVISYGDIVRKDNMTIKEASALTDKNSSNLTDKGKELRQHSSKYCDWWFAVSVVMMIFIFFAMVLFMRIFHKH
ncbi:Vesicle transport protein USE1 [Trichinella britovi]|uniref:Vesicle transport protein USE1 n=2 Tax=Trichinella TaxID=6333 RepID=A0A0V1CB03_TRIBR|nr:Vesicle transport protein USE1 [Trichinella murrelli]KRX52135.1 Vesicle transport protein USE1 [Trichinella sp. T9]KRY44842.1 Vesicle transport protein USE1 [Trichinella britovi]KRZ82085.1 Vesicle transport protein USE1 [Trichinella sp. T8]KRX34730.1 Vesicle transport protein USE1 [Trichinella murrelli]